MTPSSDDSGAVTVARVRSQLQSGEARAIREQAGLSQQEIARSLGVHELSVNAWETGRKVPRYDAALAYARLLDQLQDLAR
jgi:DNA-binding transcriptional regulator YiaG